MYILISHSFIITRRSSGELPEDLLWVSCRTMQNLTSLARLAGTVLVWYQPRFLMICSKVSLSLSVEMFIVHPSNVLMKVPTKYYNQT